MWNNQSGQNPPFSPHSHQGHLSGGGNNNYDSTLNYDDVEGVPLIDSTETSPRDHGNNGRNPNNHDMKNRVSMLSPVDDRDRYRAGGGTTVLSPGSNAPYSPKDGSGGGSSSSTFFLRLSLKEWFIIVIVAICGAGCLTWMYRTHTRALYQARIAEQQAADEARILAQKESEKQALLHYKSVYANGKTFPKADQPLPDALEYVCSGLPVTDDAGARLHFYLFPMHGTEEGEKVFDECWDKFFWPDVFGKNGGINWGHFEKVFELHPESMDSPEPPSGHRWNPHIDHGYYASGNEVKEALKNTMMSYEMTWYVFLVDSQTRTVVMTGYLRHPYIDARNWESTFFGGYFWEVQVAKDIRGHHACAMGMVNYFEQLQRVYNSPESDTHIARLWPKFAHLKTPPGEKPHWLKKLMICDSSWQAMTRDQDYNIPRATHLEQDQHMWIKKGHHHQTPGVLRDTIDKYTEIDKNGVYVVDNTEPYDFYFKSQSYMGRGSNTLFQPKNHPQPLDNHLGNTYGSSCYRSPHTNPGTISGMRLPEPAFVATGFAPDTVCFDKKGIQCDAMLPWKFNYFYDMPKWGEDGVSDSSSYSKKFQYEAEVEWMKDDESMAEEKKKWVLERQAKSKDGRTDVDEKNNEYLWLPSATRERWNKQRNYGNR